VEICAQIILQRKQRQFDLLWEQSNRTTARQLAVKDYNIWAIGTRDVGYSLQTMTSYGELIIINILMQADIEYLKKRIKVKYMVKLVRQNMDALTLFLLDKPTSEEILCPESYYILENSVGYQYLLKPYPTKFYANQVAFMGYNRNCIDYTQMRVLKQLKDKKVVVQTKAEVESLEKERKTEAERKMQEIQSLKQKLENS
jgi:hypothetical protein